MCDPADRPTESYSFILKSDNSQQEDVFISACTGVNVQIYDCEGTCIGGLESTQEFTYTHEKDKEPYVFYMKKTSEGACTPPQCNIIN